MAITFQCEHCQAKYKAPETLLGKRAKCPKCGQDTTIGAIAPADPPSSVAPVTNVSLSVEPPSPKASTLVRVAKQANRGASAVAVKQPMEMQGTTNAKARPDGSPSRRARLTADELMASFNGKIKRTTPPLGYRISVLLVAIVMFVLPAIYIALIALTGYAVYYHAVNHTGIVGMGTGRAKIFSGLVYLAPIVVGPVCALFMIKPLFARSDRGEKSRSLNRQHEPLLFAFVDRICEEVRAPRPKRIDVDCQVNASASFRRGVWSMFGNDLVLTIGLPLAAGLTMREFGGVLAHEFGHFAQGAGMRLSYLVRSISHWFVRVVYERDSWDAWLEESAASLDIRIGWILYVAMLMVWLTRKILWILMHVGFLVAGVLLRQMEFDADRYEARLAGSDAFASTVRKLHQLNLGFSRAQSQLGQSYRENRLSDDLPALIVQNSKRLPPEAEQWIETVIGQSKTGLFDTHPCDRERIEAAMAEAAEGIFRLERTAAELLSDFTAHSKATTWELYRSVFGNHIQRQALRPVSQMIEQEEKQDRSAKSLNGYTQGLWRISRPIALRSCHLSRPADPQATVDRLKIARTYLIETSPAAREQLEKFDEADKKSFNADLAAAYLRAGFKLKADNFGPELMTKEGCDRIRQQAGRDLDAANTALAEADKALADRLLAALELLQLDRVASRLADGAAVRTQVDQSLAALSAINGQSKTLLRIRNQFYPMSALLQHLDNNRDNATYVGALTSMSDKLQPLLPKVREVLERCPYPFEHGHRELTLGSYLMPESPRRDFGSVVQCSGELLDRLPELLHRILAQLSETAEHVEKILGMPPLEPPPDPSDNEKS